MLKCLRFHQTKSTNVFPSIRFKAFRYCSSRHQSIALFTQNAQNNKVDSAVQRCIHSTAQQSALAQERSKYESNNLPQSTRVVICGGGVMGGK